MVVKHSSFGSYQGYSAMSYDGWLRQSRYVSVRDGTRLAVDILRPTVADAPADEPLPVIWTHTRYQRASWDEHGSIVSTVQTWDPWLVEVMRHGYVVVTVDVRGAGASFGRYEGQYSPDECRDAYDITEWLAQQPWCDGNVGMYGRSYLGITQYFAAAEQPPHLKAIFPEMASFDHYSYAYGGGVFREASRFNWQSLCANLDNSIPTLWKGAYSGPVAGVDEDPDGALLGAALREHRYNRDWFRTISRLPYRDSADAESGEQIHFTRSAAGVRSKIEAAQIPIYHLAGWYDMFPRDTLLWLQNVSNPQKAVIGPWYHVDSHGLDFAAEHLRWYDYWLKGIDNGVMSEPRIHYWTIDAPDGEQWRATDEWPLPNQVLTEFHFLACRSPSAASDRDGRLDTCPGNYESGFDEYRVDYSTTTGLTNRWANANGGPTGYPDMSVNDAKSLTYTSSPLEETVEVTGHPVVHLWVSTEASDADFYVYLEDVHPDGRSQYVTEGVLRATHRKLTSAPWDNLGLPYHPSGEADLLPVPAGQPMELVFDLHPTSKRFQPGHRLRVAISSADVDNDRNAVTNPPPTIRVLRDPDHPSRIVLPVIGA